MEMTLVMQEPLVKAVGLNLGQGSLAEVLTSLAEVRHLLVALQHCWSVAMRHLLVALQHCWLVALRHLSVVQHC